jgi:hypothetical protein
VLLLDGFDARYRFLGNKGRSSISGPAWTRRVAV